MGFLPRLIGRILIKLEKLSRFMDYYTFPSALKNGQIGELIENMDSLANE